MENSFLKKYKNSYLPKLISNEATTRREYNEFIIKTNYISMNNTLSNNSKPAKEETRND